MIWPFGEGPVGAWLERRRTLRDLKRVLAFEDATISLRDDNPLHRAKVLVEVDDLKGAREFLEVARIRIPNYVLTSPDTVDILLGLHDFADLESLALTGAKRFPKRPHYLEGYALAAERQRHFDEAVRRWALVRKRFPYRLMGYVCGVSCLRALGRLGEAEALLRSAMRFAPNDITLQFEYSRIAEAREDWEEAYRRWDIVRPRHVAGCFGAAWALQKLGRTAEAEEILAAGRFSYPIEPSLAIMQARIAEDSGNKAEALKRWGVVRQRFPFNSEGYLEAVRLLREQLDWVEADAIAQAAIERFPSHSWPLEAYANLAHLRKDWPEAAKRWAALLAAFPDWRDGDKWQREAEAAAKAATGQSRPHSEASSN